VEILYYSLVFFYCKIVLMYVCTNTKLIIKAPHVVGTSDMSLSKQSASGNESSGGY
jgi:hypothetical protein